MPQQNSEKITASLIDISLLKPDAIYLFQIRERTSPQGDVVPARFTERIYLGPVELENTPFIEVARSNGREHLIAVETIEGWEELSRPAKLRTFANPDN